MNAATTSMTAERRLRNSQRGNLWTPAQSRSGRRLRRSRRSRAAHSSETVAPPLRFSPAAWAKLLWLRDAGPTEIGGFAVTPPRAEKP